MNRWPGFPLIASEHGSKIQDFILFVHIVMLLAFLGWGAWLTTSLIRFRRKRNATADYHGLRTRLPYVLVALMATAEASLLFGLSIPYWEREIVAAPDARQRLRVVRIDLQPHKFEFLQRLGQPEITFGFEIEIQA